MKIIECGRSVQQFMCGNTSAPKTYACVLAVPQEKTIEQGLAEMKRFFVKEKMVLDKKLDKFTFAMKDSTEYTLAHSIGCVKGKLVYKPSNLLRHLLCRPFTIEGLYKDEVGEVVNLSAKSVDDIRSNNLRPLMKHFDKWLNSEPENLSHIFKQTFENNYEFSNALLAVLGKFTPVRPIKDYTELTKLIETYKDRFIKVAQAQNRVWWYLHNMCGMKYEIQFAPNPKIVMPPLSKDDNYLLSKEENCMPYAPNEE